MKLLKRPKPITPALTAIKENVTKPKLIIRKNPVITVSKSKDLDAKEKARNQYREAHNIELNDCRDNLARLADYGKVKILTLPNGKVREICTFTITAIGEPLNTTGVTATRWLNADMLPAPIIASGRTHVYHIDEVRSFIKIIGDNQTHFKQYRKEHVHVTDMLFRENALLRKSLFDN
jgi:hypothetical protein